MITLTPILARILTGDPFNSWPLLLRKSVRTSFKNSRHWICLDVSAKKVCSNTVFTVDNYPLIPGKPPLSINLVIVIVVFQVCSQVPDFHHPILRPGGATQSVGREGQAKDFRPMSGETVLQSPGMLSIDFYYVNFLHDLQS